LAMYLVQMALRLDTSQTCRAVPASSCTQREVHRASAQALE
jgi:hypothetical protein